MRIEALRRIEVFLHKNFNPIMLIHLFKRHGGDDDEDEEEISATTTEAADSVVGEVPIVGITGLPTSGLDSSSSLGSTSSSSTIAQGNVGLAFGLVGIAALFGLFGSLLGVYIPRRSSQARSKQFLAASLSLSGGILVFLSLTDILVEARSEFRR
jgi:hypothetical protein